MVRAVIDGDVANRTRFEIDTVLPAVQNDLAHAPQRAK
jgi:hypothetical protein